MIFTMLASTAACSGVRLSPAPRSTAPQTNERKSAMLVAAVTCR